MASELDSVDTEHSHHCRKVCGTVLLSRVWKELCIPLEKEILSLIIIEFVVFVIYIEEELWM